MAQRFAVLSSFICDVNMMSLCFSKDSVPAHCTCDTIELLRRTTPDLIVPNVWPPNSPDVDLVDYVTWSVIQQRVYETRVHDDELRQHLLHVWCSMEQSLIDDAVDQWPTRLRACVHARGGHFEQICDYQFVFFILVELYISQLCLMQQVMF